MKNIDLHLTICLSLIDYFSISAYKVNSVAGFQNLAIIGASLNSMRKSFKLSTNLSYSTTTN